MTPGPGHDLEEELAAGRPGRRLGPWWLGILGLVVASVLLVTTGLRQYGYTLGATLAVLALLRLVLDERRAGALVVRGRAVDVVTLLGLGAAVAVLTSYLRLG